MRIVSAAELKSGDILAKAVEGKNGMVMLEAGTVLTEKYITGLRNLKVRAVHIDHRRNEPLVNGPENGYQTYVDYDLEKPDIESLKNNTAAREQAVEQIRAFAERGMNQERILLPIGAEAFREQFREVMNEVISQRVFAEELGVMLLTDNLLLEQALHVSLCSNILGAAQGYDKAKLYELTIGSLFADIGMTRLPATLFKTSRELTQAERQLMMQHTSDGFRILKSMKEVPLAAAQCALLHHERYRGSGYPLAMSHQTIPEFAQIVGIADVYNALISPRHHRNSYDPGEAIEYLFASGNYEFELSLVQVFLRHLSIYPVSTVVRLSNGQKARILETTGRPIQRPFVEVFCEADGFAIPSPYPLELQKYPTIVIVGKADK